MQIFFIALIFALAAGSSACVSPESETIGASVAPAPAHSSIPASDPNYLPITLPVLDALLADEAFRTELKYQIGLSDEQINQLSAVASEENSVPRETADWRGAAALTRSRKRIAEAIGEEKAARLHTLAREWWSDAAVATASILPTDIPADTRIVINTPAYRMDIFENGKLVKSYRIGIGYPEFPLPTGMRMVDAIIFNPTWTPPNEPWVKSSGSKIKAGQIIAAGSKLNPLGLVKIPIGLPSLIHGGKSPAQLGGFASHGCVGLTNAQVISLSKRLAQLGGVEITDDQIAKYRRSRTETRNIVLQQAIPVEFRYETIVVEDGKLRIYRDVYERGTNTEENLRNALGAYGMTLESLSGSERSRVFDALNQMGRDANGKEVPDTGLSPGAAPSKRQNASGKKTRRVIGEKMIVIEIPALAGKGYAAPVELDSGEKETL
ncbi:MAG: L,D-transpeptidase [Blastocatellales bacterium]